ncbi:MAG: MFS transporter [Sporomusaceae bacterium]|nr:MFS transporter [Sporomusaceae bacterium]
MAGSADDDARRLTALAYFMMMSIGVTFSLAGVTTKQIAATFAVDTGLVGYVFTLFSVGYSAAIFGNGFLLDRVDTGRETALAAAAAGLAALAATLLPSLAAFAAAIFAYGVFLGVLCSVGYFVIVNLYDEAVRAAKLNVLNFFFSVGSVAAPVLAGLALQRGASWQAVFQATAPLAFAAAAWALSARFTLRPPAPRLAGPDGDRSRWGWPVYVIGAALICYVISEMAFTYWLVTYMMDRLAADVATAGLALSLFWVTMGSGRLAAGPLIVRLGVGRYIGGFSLLAAGAFAALLTADTPAAALWLTAAMGAGYSGLYPTILSLGTELVPGPSPRLTTFFLSVGAGGGIMALLLSSWLKQVAGVGAVMTFAASLLAAMALLVWTAGRGRRCPAGGEE